MNYKTILLCAVIGASMQNAWGMDEEVSDWHIQSDRFFRAETQVDLTEHKCKEISPEWESIPWFQGVIEKKADVLKQMGVKSVLVMKPGELKNYAIQMEAVAKELEDTLARYHATQIDRALVGVKLFVAVKVKWDEAGLSFENSKEFKSVDSDIKKFNAERFGIASVDIHEGKETIINLGIQAGHVAKKLHAALQKYEERTKK